MAYEITRIDRTQIENFIYFFTDKFLVSALLEHSFALTYPVIPYSEHVYINKGFLTNEEYQCFDTSLKFFPDRVMNENDEVYVTYATTVDVNVIYVFYDELGNAIITENGDFIGF